MAGLLTGEKHKIPLNFPKALKASLMRGFFTSKFHRAPQCAPDHTESKPFDMSL
jgi:hypothetical protein